MHSLSCRRRAEQLKPVIGMLEIFILLIINHYLSSQIGAQCLACAYEAFVTPHITGRENIVIKQNRKITLIKSRSKRLRAGFSPDNAGQKEKNRHDYKAG
ncbi:hypothetical protein S7A_11415 [Pantoea sp. Sc1]|nr:hypothetical protein S7A_11415 [Pantoea sp. Sc1]